MACAFRMNDHEHGIINDLYVENDVASDPLRGRSDWLRGFTDEFNRRVDADYTCEEVGDELVALRKRGHLRRVGRNWNGPKFPGSAASEAA